MWSARSASGSSCGSTWPGSASSGRAEQRVLLHLGLKLLTGKDHDESYARFSAGEADAFATDDVLLYGQADISADV